MAETAQALNALARHDTNKLRMIDIGIVSCVQCEKFAIFQLYSDYMCKFLPSRLTTKS